MARVKRGVTTHARHKKMVEQAAGYRGRASTNYRVAIEKVEKGLRYAYRDRRNKKRTFRGLWIQRINAGVREHGTWVEREGVCCGGHRSSLHRDDVPAGEAETSLVARARARTREVEQHDDDRRVYLDHRADHPNRQPVQAGS